MTDREEIAYQPLTGPLTIRVVKLLPSKEDQLECTVHYGRLDELRYQCLSYVWGEPKRRYRIIVRNDESGAVEGYIALTLNLYHALKDLRDSAEVEDKTYWIDQICIHQEDLNEKGSQVALMGEIYKHAAAVILYLGPAKPFDEEGFNLISLLWNHFRPSLKRILEMTWYGAYRRSEKLPVESMPDSVSLDHPGWVSLIDMAFGVWTERSWIVQENVVNRNTYMLRGQKRLEWIPVATMAVLFGVGLLPLVLLDDMRAKKTASLDCYIDAISHSLEFRLEYEGARSQSIQPADFSTTLQGNFDWYDALGCSDPRDHIYSIMGISTDAQDLGLVPEYQSDIYTVFTSATVRMLEHYRSLEHFYYVSLLDNLTDASYPSWSWTPNLLGRQHYLEHYLYKAHPIAHSTYRFNNQQKDLVVRGRTIDQVVYSAALVRVHGSTFWGITKLESVVRLVNELHSFTLVLKRAGYTRENCSQLLLALIAEKCHTDDGNEIRKDPVISLCIYLDQSWLLVQECQDGLPEELRNKLPDVKDMITAVKGLLSEQQRLLPEVEETTIAGQINSQKVTFGRAFGLTEQGRIVNSTFKAAVGDVVVLLQGGSTPYILRSVGSNFRYVGDVCVPGIMYGEAYEGLDPIEMDNEMVLV